MEVTFQNDGKKESNVTVDEYGRISIGREYADKTIEVAFEVQDNEE